ncbi:MAG: GtrA family protein [Intestinibacter sp.]|uniref:GtrA family protein n=1 Tax=Intestinibacter sp. TaxID=1965304 RepID=UPI003F1859D3
MENIRESAIKFVFTSGIGWILDFGIYIILSKYFGWEVLYANFCSAIPSISFVFIVSTSKIFKNKKTKVSLSCKYLIYFTYQMVLILSVSYIGQVLYGVFINLVKIPFILAYLKIFIKIIITPITLILNFLFMNILIEKI